ncbi:MAG: MFS transporter [Candidatus Koribacter versatilis]|uniref:MFS transporter n=1 Tax=Candidatus Korobacter versatilis TaxID=658062 RepID=A0A932AAM0_9BACT|nr:MFS transporter [Candidatus Koribacter versatilis]
MTFSTRLQDIRTGFERPFWVANITEIFERLSYYSVFAVLVRYLNEGLGFSIEQAGTLGGFFGAAVWFMAIFGGAVADKIGFRRALSLAYFILSGAYFLVGSIGAPWLAPVRHAVPLPILAGAILFLPALGVALVKPSVVGTTARASTENVRSIGYSIYYTMVNVGSFLGPYLAGFVRERVNRGEMRLEDVFRIASLSVLLMFIAVLIFFKEPRRAAGQPVPSVGTVARNFFTVLGNVRFVLFLLIFAGYWVVFWQQYLILPAYIHNYVDASANTEWILITDPLIVIFFTVAINAATRKVPSFHAVTLGTFVTAIGWLVLPFWHSKWAAVVALAVVAIGEIIQSPRYYEYISRLAPAGQQGTYMGFAFLPIGIGSLIGGWLAGKHLHHYGEVTKQPEVIWYIVTGVGLLTAALLYLYDRVVQPMQQEGVPES